MGAAGGQGHPLNSVCTRLVEVDLGRPGISTKATICTPMDKSVCIAV
jgi:hypothetical protein